MVGELTGIGCRGTVGHPACTWLISTNLGTTCMVTHLDHLLNPIPSHPSAFLAPRVLFRRGGQATLVERRKLPRNAIGRLYDAKMTSVWIIDRLDVNVGVER